MTGPVPRAVSGMQAAGEAAIDALSRATAWAAQAMLQGLGLSFERQGDQLRHASGFVAQVHADCTAAWPVAVWLLALAAAWLAGSRGKRGPGGPNGSNGLNGRDACSPPGVRHGSPWPVRVPALPRVLARALAAAMALALTNQLRLVVVLWGGAVAPASFGWLHEVAGPLFLVAVGTALLVWTLRPPRYRTWVTPARPALARGLGCVGLILLVSQGASMAQSPGRPEAGGAAPSQAQAASIVSGDLIVKFRDATEPGRQLAEVLAGKRTVAGATPLAQRLSRELGLPLVLAQVTSGREALLAVDREALGRQLLARAGREASVQRAVMTVPPPSAGTPGGLPAAELVLRLQTRPGTSAAVREALPGRLALAGLVRPLPQPDGEEAHLRLRYDLDALTLALIAKVQQRADVEYAQANRLLRPQAPPAAPASR
jgi:exosortase/archaeosortase family protein